ncbi:hypothetical protein AYI70_g7848 [Smittium culicis]|uniref:Uncharacterized protein n=1 Tax=Smittium culicis TaxID=133412 RepID=A0A1R1XIN6_9FUNG|nr:hypothetical protein AYI70_g7848 [Smittium culicis]
MERESKSSANMFDLISRVVSGNGFKNGNSSKGLGIVEDENDGNSSRDRKRAGNSACRKILGYGKGNGCSIGGESRGGKGVVNKKAEMNDENWVRLNPVKVKINGVVQEAYSSDSRRSVVGKEAESGRKSYLDSDGTCMSSEIGDNFRIYCSDIDGVEICNSGGRGKDNYCGDGYSGRNYKPDLSWYKSRDTEKKTPSAKLKTLAIHVLTMVVVLAMPFTFGSVVIGEQVLRDIPPFRSEQAAAEKEFSVDEQEDIEMFLSRGGSVVLSNDHMNGGETTKAVILKNGETYSQKNIAAAL